MILKHYLPVVAMAAVSLTSYASNEGENGMNAGLNFANMDTSVKPGTDFYEYACGGWMKTHPLTGEYARFGSFDMLADNNLVQLKDLVTELSNKKNPYGTVAQKISDLYSLAMDSVLLNKEGMKPIKSDMARISAVKNKKQLFSLATELYKEGSQAFGVYILMQISRIVKII